MVELNGSVAVINVKRVMPGVGIREGCVMVMRSDRHIISLADRKKKADHVLALIACFT